MATATTTTTGAGPDARDGLSALLRNRALGKLLLFAVFAAVLVPLALTRWSGTAWPGALTVDLSEPLGHASDWIIDNRDSHPLFTYFFGYISNGVVLSVRGVYLLLLGAGWAGVTAAAGLIAWRVAGVRLALTAAVSFAVCGLLGMWVPTMQTLALMVVAVTRVRRAGSRARSRRRTLGPPLPGAAAPPRHHAGTARLRLSAARGADLRHRCPGGGPGDRRVRGSADGPAHRARPAQRRRRGDGGRLLARRDRPAAAAERAAAARPQATAPRPQPDDHDGALDGRHRVRDRRRRPRRPRVPGAGLGRRGRGARRGPADRAARRGPGPGDGSRRIRPGQPRYEPVPYGMARLGRRARGGRRGRGRRTPRGPARLARRLDREHRRARQHRRRLDDRPPLLGRPRHRRHRRLGRALHHLDTRPDARRAPGPALVVRPADRRRPRPG